LRSDRQHCNTKAEGLTLIRPYGAPINQGVIATGNHWFLIRCAEHHPRGRHIIEKDITMEFITNSPQQTEALGAALGKILTAGSIIAYQGDLGAGKTAFTRGLARGLGCTDLVTSPTYTIVNEYLSGRLPLFHFDMYRLHSSDDLWDIGWEDYLDRGGICAVEWSENVADAMENAITVRVEKLGEESRRITIEGGIDLATLSL